MTSIARITLINEGVMRCRFAGIYREFVNGNTKVAIAFTKETLQLLDHASENEMSVELTEYYATMLERTLMELRNNMRGCTKERLWTLAYTNDLYM